jgi:ribosomal protein L24E
MPFLYRTAVTVIRKQPYLDWANSFDDGGPELTNELAEDRRTVYLVGESDGRPDLRRLLDDYWEEIFEKELAMWMEAEDDWPASRTREMFDAWFDAEITDTVIDLVPEEALTETDVELADLAEAFQLCAWCDVPIEQGQGRFVPFQLAHRDRFAHRAGLTLSLLVGHGRTVVGAVTPDDSKEAADGDDIVFRACSSRCEKAIRKVVPKALRKAAAMLE